MDYADDICLHLQKIANISHKFTNVLAVIISEVCCVEKRGILWNLLHQLKDLDYADDICLLLQKIANISHKFTNVLADIISEVCCLEKRGILWNL